MKEIIQGFYQKKHFWTRLILVIAAVILMGFALSWLLLVDLGTDPCTLLNQTISQIPYITHQPFQTISRLLHICQAVIRIETCPFSMFPLSHGTGSRIICLYSISQQKETLFILLLLISPEAFRKQYTSLQTIFVNLRLQ